MQHPESGKSVDQATGFRLQFLAPGMVFVMLLVVWWLGSAWYKQSLLESEHAATNHEIFTRHEALANAIETNLAILDGLVALIESSESGEITEDKFTMYSASILAGKVGIRNISLAPDGIQQYIYPLEGNEGVIGHDLINDKRPEVRSDVNRAIQSGKVIVSGPYELRQGGQGFVARRAIFREGVFWGLAVEVIDVQDLLAVSDIDPATAGVSFSLRNEQDNIFYGDGSVFESDPVIQKLVLPSESWELAAVPTNGWDSAISSRLLLFQGGGLAIILLLSAIVYLFASRHLHLSNAVRERTASLKDAIERYRQLFECSPDALFLISGEERFIDANQVAVDRFGYSREELLDMGPVDLTAPDLKAKAPAHLRELMTVQARFEWRHQCKDGSELPVEIITRQVEIGGTQYILANVRDITDRRQAEHALLASETRLHAIFEYSRDAIGVSLAGTHTLVNPAYVKLFGYEDESELIGRPILDLIAPDERDRIREYVQKRVSGENTPSSYETRAIRKDGSEFDMDVSVSTYELEDEVYTLVILSDITERKQAEEAIKRGEQVLRLFIENTPAAIAMFDREMKYIVASRRYLIDYELGEQDVVGRSHYELFPEMPERWKEIHKRCLAGETLSADEDPFPRASGKLDWVRWEIRPWYETQGVIGGIILFSEVITERKKATEELEKHRLHLEEIVKERTSELKETQDGLIVLLEDVNETREELKQANTRLLKLNRLKNLFIAGMSHELRTPLNSIIGFTGIMLMGLAGDLSDEQRKQLNMVKSSSQHLLSLINDIIDVSKVEAGTVELITEEFRLGDVLDETREAFANAIDEKGLELRIDAPMDLSVTSDRRRIKQVVMNLLSNAVKFTESGKIEISAVREDEIVLITVADTGIGIRDGDMEKLFKQFSRITEPGRPQQEGTGLGLYLSQKIAKMVGGEITAASRYGEGSVFTFVFPAEMPDADMQNKGGAVAQDTGN